MLVIGAPPEHASVDGERKGVAGTGADADDAFLCQLGYVGWFPADLVVLAESELPLQVGTAGLKLLFLHEEERV